MKPDDDEDIVIERVAVESSDIKSVGYSALYELLDIEFKTGDVYRYSQVPTEKMFDFAVAESLGKYFHQHIKGKYGYTKLESHD